MFGRFHHAVGFVLLLALASVAAPALSQVSDGDASVENVTYAGDALVDSTSPGTHVWRDGTHEFHIAVGSTSGLDGGTVCLFARTEATPTRKLTCERASVGADSSTTETLRVDAWPTNLTGRASVDVELLSASDAVLDRTSRRFTVIARTGDLDRDGLTNEREVAAGTGLEANDTDGDGLDDGTEVDTYGTDPTASDTDGDGLPDVEEIERYLTDPGVVDTDGDGTDDAREVRVGTDPNVADTDGDGLDDALEVNTYGTNASKPDTDGDGLDDGAEVRDHATSPTNPDTDGDGLPDNLEIFTYGTDPNAIDTDGDGLKDGNEVYEYRTDPIAESSDDDALSDGAEINIHGTNPKKADTDGDGLDDAAEVERFETDPKTADTDGDGVGDRAEVDRSTFVPPSLAVILAVVGALVTAVGGAFVYRTERPFPEIVREARRAVPWPFSRFDDGTEGDDGPESEAGDERTDATGRSPGRRDGVVDCESMSTRADASGDGNPQATDSAADVDLDLLPNAEGVLALLAANDGKMRQSTLVEETGWSKAKVSRVLSEMEAEDRIVKVPVGRGNLITTPDDVPSGARSPFDE